MTVTDASPLIKTRSLECSADHAFDIYVDKMADWWPLADHSVFAGESRGVVVEHGVGGRLVETHANGEEAVWGTLTVWEPRRRIAHTWHPGQGAESATAVEVTFDPEGHGCLLTLTHTGWDGDAVSATRAGYEEGWPLVLDSYLALVTR